MRVGGLACTKAYRNSESRTAIMARRLALLAREWLAARDPGGRCPAASPDAAGRHRAGGRGGNRPSRAALALALVLIPAPPGATALAAAGPDLDQLPDRLPYECAVSPNFDRFPSSGVAQPPFLACDLDRDGWDEIVIGVQEGFVARDCEGDVPLVLWQENYPVGWIDGYVIPHFLPGCCDLDRNGWPEILWTGNSDDGRRWRLRAYEPHRDGYVVDLELPVGEDRKPDGRWDGSYWPVGVLEPGEAVPDGERPAVVLAVTAGYDLQPRGLVAIDPFDGRELWRYATGTNPHEGSIWLGDLEGDGRREILMVGGTSNNMPPGMVVGGTRDDQCVLYRLDTTGRPAWMRELGRGNFGAHLKVADLDGDGVPEIVTGDVPNNPGDVATVRLWGGGGELLARKVMAGTMLGMETAAAGAAGPGAIYAGSTAGDLSRLTWDGTRLTLAGRALAAGGVQVITVGELARREPGLEVVAKTASGRYAFLDRRLRPLAAFLYEGGFAREIQGLVWAAAPDLDYALLGDRWLLVRHLRESPAAAGPWGLAAAAAILAGVGGLWGWRRVRERERRRAAESPTADRERLALLLRKLEQSGHGAVAVTRHVRRLAWLLGALADQAEPGGQVADRAQQVWLDFRESSRAELAGVLALARGTPCGRRVPEIAAALDRFTGAVGRVLGQGGGGSGSGGAGAAAALAEVRRAAAEIDDGLSALRREVEAFFTVDLRRLLERILLLREDELERAGVEVRLGPPDAPAELPCQADPADLRFAVDNLVGNAIDAMLGSERRELRLELSRQEGQGVLVVADTGSGIAPERRRTLFQVRGGDAGGLGLGRSRDLLRRWQGDLELEASEPGRGSRFRLRVPLAGAPRAGEAT